MARRKKTAKQESNQMPKKIVEENPNKAAEKQFLWLVGIIIVIILGFVLIPMIYKQTVNKFEYGGVKFEKIKDGQLTFYHGQFPIIYKGNLTAIYNIYLRNDPRENTIPVNTNLTLSKNISISVEDEVERCGDRTLGQSELGKFFHAFPFVKSVAAGRVNQTTAKEMNITQVTCQNASLDHTVIILQKSETPSVELGDKKNCYVLKVGDCQYLETIERYIIAVMAQINEKPLA